MMDSLRFPRTVSRKSFVVSLKPNIMFSQSNVFVIAIAFRTIGKSGSQYLESIFVYRPRREPSRCRMAAANREQVQNPKIDVSRPQNLLFAQSAPSAQRPFMIIHPFFRIIHFLQSSEAGSPKNVRRGISRDAVGNPLRPGDRLTSNILRRQHVV